MIVMGTCKTCRHWTAPTRNLYLGGIDGNPNLGACGAGKLFEHGAWDEAGRPTDAVVYSYDELGCFATGPDFGCVHHLPR